MDKQQAINLVRTTFESPFNREQFTAFIGRLLNQIEPDPFTYTGQFIPDAFRTHVRQYERLGKYKDSDGRRIDILIVTLQRETAVEHARATQRRFVAGYLQGKYGSKGDKDAALVAFVAADDKDDWRFSLVKLETRLETTARGGLKAVDEFSPARRYSFLVGADEKSHTAQTRLAPLLQEAEHNPTLAQLEEAFNIEKVTKEFFDKYRDLFIRTKAQLDKAVAANPKAKADLDAKGVDTVNLAKKLLGQVIFLYYLQKKGWFGVPRDGEWGDGSKQFLRELFQGKHGTYTNFFNDILEPLFYEALRIDRSHDDHYYSRFNCRIPFLNGGLFDPMGNYDWVRADILLANDLFSNQNKTPEGDTGDGILDIFDRYNFTVQEDEPLEKEVAIDPELLGKAYEKFNAIRPDNYDEFVRALSSGKKGEESKFNKQYGVYYTPREIVHYMCQQSLIHYLTTAMAGQVSQAEVTLLIEQGETWRENDARVAKEGRETGAYPWLAPVAVRQNAALLDKKLAAMTVCDPAVGSGAFPVGMMSEIVQARQTLSTYLAMQTPGVSENPRGLGYAFKRACIEHALYGVDIDPGAVEIAKLRLWLSLIVDEDDIQQIKPLPNLDYKIVCGNSLIGFPDNYQSAIGQEISDLMRRHFNETNVRRKNELKAAIDAKIESRYANSQRALGYTVNFDFKTVFAEVFQQNGGFDVVIGNPPYVRQELLKEQKPTLQNYHRDVYTGTADLYVYFYNRGYQILRKGGVLAYITSNKWLRANYGNNLRQHTAKTMQLHQLIDFGELPVFDAATFPMIFVGSKGVENNPFSFLQVQSLEHPYPDLPFLMAQNGQTLPTEAVQGDKWSLTGNEFVQLIKKMEEIGKPLSDYVGKQIYRGVLTGFNTAFVIDESKRAELIATDPRSTELIKPLAVGDDVRKWQINFKQKYLIFTRRGINIEMYPAIKRHLQQWQKELTPKTNSNQKVGRKPGSYQWYEIQDNIAYYAEFDKPKIVYPIIAKEPRFTFDTQGMYLNDKTFFIPLNDLYLLGVLNSKLVWEYLKNICSVLGDPDKGGRLELRSVHVSQLPIPNASSKQKLAVEILVNQILTAKQTNPQANTTAWEAEIDRHVYALYGLTPAEIAIVEGRA